MANLGFAYRLKRLAQIPLSESQPFARNAQNIQLIFRIQLTCEKGTSLCIPMDTRYCRCGFCLLKKHGVQIEDLPCCETLRSY